MKTHLSPRELGAAIGVSNSSLKRWVDSGQIDAPKTAGGHRRIPIAEAVRFIRESGIKIVQPEALGLYAATAGETEQSVETLARLLNESKLTEASSFILSEYLAGNSFSTICDDLIQPVLKQIGELWLHGDEGIQIEHQAVDLLTRTINQLRNLIVTRENRPVAVGGAVENDPYILPSLMAATTLAFEGWQEINLGANTPLRVIDMAARQSQAQIVWLSISSDKARCTANDIMTLADALGKIGTQVVVGGRAVPHLKASPDNLHHLSSMTALGAFAKGVAQTRTRSNGQTSGHAEIGRTNGHPKHEGIS